MRFAAQAILAFLAALPLAASTMEVSRQNSVTLHTGDALIFRLSISSISDNGILVSRAGFTFTGSPSGESWNFLALLESIDQSASLAFPGLAYMGGQSRSSSVQMATGTLPLVKEGSAGIFGKGGVLLSLLNLGGEVTLGRSGFTLADDLSFSFSGLRETSRARTSGGGVVTGVSLVEAPPVTLETGGFYGDEAGGSETPEPASGVLITAAAALLWIGHSRLRNAGFRR